MGRDLTTTFIGNGEPTFHRNSFQRRPPSTAQLSSPSRFLAAFAAATQEWILLWRKEGLLPNYVIKKKKRKEDTRPSTLGGDMTECGADGCQRLHWPSASLSFHDCAADVKNSLFKAELVTFRRPSMEAWGEQEQRYGTPDVHTAAEKTSAFISCTWCIAKPKKKKKENHSFAGFMQKTQMTFKKNPFTFCGW